MSRIYLMARSYLDRLLADRRDLFIFARSVKNADELRAARDDMMASAQINRTPKPGEQVKLSISDGVAHIPVVGQLTPSADPCGAFTGQAETEYGFIQAALIAAEDDPAVHSIALDINSPGGYLDGLDETAQLLAAVTKPTTAYIGALGASAAYWLASQADKIVATSPASLIGSIGVATEEYNDDQALADEGIAHRVYTSTDAPNKRPDTNTPDGQAQIVAELDALHSVFVRRVSEGRGVSVEHVNENFGRGGVKIAADALSAGMIDNIIGDKIEYKNTGVAGSSQAAGLDTKTQGVDMTDQEIQAMKAEAYQAGIQAERQRIADLAQYSGKFGASVDAIVSDAQATGKSLSDVKVQIDVAVMQAKSAGENAPEAQTGTAKNAAAAEDFTVNGMSAQDVKTLMAAGMTIEQIRANVPRGY